MRNALFVEIVRWFVEKKNIRILDECLGEKETCLLTSGKSFQNPVVRSLAMHDIQNFLDSRRDVLNLFWEYGSKEFLDCGVYLLARDYLPGGRNCRSFRD